MRLFSSFILLSLLGFHSAYAAESLTKLKDAYRLSGLVITTEGRNLAFLEAPDGQQLSLREGDAVGENGKVLEINYYSLRIRYPEGEEVFYLKGYNGPPIVKDKIKNQAAQIVLKNENMGAVLRREVAADALLSVFKEQKIAIEDEKIKDLSTYLTPLLELPPKARIVGVDRSPVSSVKEAIAIISKRIADGNVVKLMIDGDEQVYLIPRVQP